MSRKYGKWHILPEDPFDESERPTEPGFYEVILEDGTQTWDEYFGEPRFTPHGCKYWRDSLQTIRAWAKLEPVMISPSEGEKNER